MNAKIELLLPAGDLARAKVAVDFGADAIYIGGENYSLRYRASNFSLADIEEICKYAHDRQRLVYVTVNMIFHDEDLKGIENYLKQLDQAEVDAVIVASPALLELCKKRKFRFAVHLSTQLSLLNSQDIAFYQQLGADRVILGREMTLADIQQLSGKITIKTEVFIQGSLCANYSGRCTLSNVMTGRDANRGGCAQPCRWNYHLYGGERLLSKKQRMFSLSTKDLCGLAMIGELIEAGVSGLKIEGRMKSAYYLAVLTRTYREYIDLFYLNPQSAIDKQPRFFRELAKAEGRGRCSGFLAGDPAPTDYLYQDNINSHQYVGRVEKYNAKTALATVSTRNIIKIGDTLEFISAKNRQTVRCEVKVMYDEDKQELKVANKPLSKISVVTKVAVHSGDFVRKVQEDDF